MFQYVNTTNRRNKQQTGCQGESTRSFVLPVPRMGSFGEMSSQWQDLQNTQLSKQAFKVPKASWAFWEKWSRETDIVRLLFVQYLEELYKFWGESGQGVQLKWRASLQSALVLKRKAENNALLSMMLTHQNAILLQKNATNNFRWINVYCETKFTGKGLPVYACGVMPLHHWAMPLLERSLHFGNLINSQI